MARILISGGSLSGLLHAYLLGGEGHTVSVYEKVAEDLSSRGGGIAAQTPLWRVLEQAGLLDPGAERPGVHLHERVVFEHDGSSKAKRPQEQTVTSWDTLYRLLHEAVPADRYHQHREVAAVEQDEQSASLLFADGSRETGDLVIAADGAGSPLRRQLLPGYEPTYAGYVAWRGLVPEDLLPGEARAALGERMTFYTPPGEQILVYPVPGPNGETNPGKRRFNFVWYRPAPEGELLDTWLLGEDGTQYRGSIPPPAIAKSTIQAIRGDAERLLPPAMRALVLATESPFLQLISDLCSPRFVFGRTVVVGDAAVLPRPHPGAGTTKAFEDAWTFHSIVRARLGAAGEPAWSDPKAVAAALSDYEQARLEAARAVWEQSRFLGTHLAPRNAGGDAPGEDQHPETLLRHTALGMPGAA